ncbi:MAG: hypothetical protein A2Y10_06070 [Planctomycetes bacterium GWF2_41_51]|nr:MAG: hypothetical protein A2Y10_06070 [Planctomycetes bacterium GWF2_41_51]
MAEFSKSLEEKAQQIIQDFDNRDWDNSIPAILKREIAFTVDQIKRFKEFHNDQIEEFYKTECDIETELLQVESRTPRYSPYKYPEREKLQRQLVGVKSEKRRQEVFYEDRMQNFEKNLLALIHKHEQVRNIDDKP